MQPIHLVVLHEGPHWIPCDYMARVAEAVAEDLEGMVFVETVIIKEMEGAKHYRRICDRLGRPAPVPALLVGESILFDRIPGKEELKTCLQNMLE